jgi:hypothetical protein
MFDMITEIVEAAPYVPESAHNCTVISLLPYPLKETKPAIIPGYFQIPAAVGNLPGVLPVGDSIHWLESPFPRQPPIKMTENSRSVAKAIVNDFIEAQLGLDSDSAPGLFYVDGHFTAREVQLKFPTRLEEYTLRQKKWFLTLVRIADDDWAQHHVHKMISDLQRYAAKALGLERDWLGTSLDAIMTPCPMCSGLVNPTAIVHAECGYIMKPAEHARLVAQGLIVGKELTNAKK